MKNISSIHLNKTDSFQLLKQIVNWWNNEPFDHCQVADFFRLSRKIQIQDEEFEILIERSNTSDNYPKLLRIRDIICFLQVIMNENQMNILSTMSIFHSHIKKGIDELKTLENILSELNPKNSSALALIKLIVSQSVVSHPYMLIKNKLNDIYSVIDNHGTWLIDVKISKGSIIITHSKSMKSNKEEQDLKGFEWHFRIIYNTSLNHIEKCELEISSFQFCKFITDTKKAHILDNIRKIFET